MRDHQVDMRQDGRLRQVPPAVHVRRQGELLVAGALADDVLVLRLAQNRRQSFHQLNIKSAH